MVSIENIKLAIHNASKKRKGKTSAEKKALIKTIKENADHYAKEIQKMLISGNFKTSKYYIYRLYEPKLRLIYCLPFYPDRIIHHVIMNVLEPIWDELMIHDSYACRKNKGQHKGGTKAAMYVRKYDYCLQGDISQFYVNVNHRILKQLLRQKIKDKKVLELLDGIVDSISTRDKNLEILLKMKRKGSKCPDVYREIAKLTTSKTKDKGEAAGVPIGNYLSQWFGNLYMTIFDNFVKHELKCKAYARYCDDFTLYSNSKEQLNEWSPLIETFLWEKLHMLMSKKVIFPTAQGVDFLGYRYFPEGYVLLRKRTAKSTRRRLQNLPERIVAGKIDIQTAVGQVASAYGWLKWANTKNFRDRIKLDEIKREVDNLAQIQ